MICSAVGLFLLLPRFCERDHFRGRCDLFGHSPTRQTEHSRMYFRFEDELTRIGDTRMFRQVPQLDRNFTRELYGQRYDDRQWCVATRRNPNMAATLRLTRVQELGAIRDDHQHQACTLLFELRQTMDAQFVKPHFRLQR